MTNKELQALRKLFFMSTAEAAEHIGGVSARSWQHWESGKYSVPDDVSIKMNQISDHRLNMIETCEDLINEHIDDMDTIDNQYYMTFDDFKARHAGADVVSWRIAQSVSAHFLGERIATLK